MIEIKDNKGKVIAKVGSEKEAIWYRVKKGFEEEIKQAETSIMLNKEFIKVCDTHIKKQK